MLETTETERKVIDILVGCGVTKDAWLEPIYAVDRAMPGWYTDRTMAFVRDLIERKLIRHVPIVRDGPIYDPKSRWEKGAGE